MLKVLHALGPEDFRLARVGLGGKLNSLVNMAEALLS